MKFLVFIAASGLLVGACGEDDPADAPIEEIAITADTAIGYETNLPAPVTPVPDSDSGFTVVGNLSEVNNSGIAGGITLTGEDSRTVLRIRVSSAEPGTSMTVGIFRGDCGGTPGEAVTAMESLPVPATGIATGTVTFPIEARAIQDGGHSVQVYTEEAGPPTPPVACAELPDIDEVPGGRDTLARQEEADVP